MILLAGIPNESPLAAVAEQLAMLGQETMIFDQREWRDADISLTSGGGRLRWSLSIGDRVFEGHEIRAAYVRLMDMQLLPDVACLAPEDLSRMHCNALHQLLIQFIDGMAGCVMNRTAPMASNCSKPLQSRLIEAYGFAVPPTLITNEPQLARAFHARHRRVIFKSMSGQRSIVTELDAEWLDRLDAIRACPVQFQALVPGTDVRVHVIGKKAIATAVASTATDYRYATRQGAPTPVLQPTTLDGMLAERCVSLVSGLGLELAGIDLRVGRDGRITCFEVNPSPAFTYYEQGSGQSIAREIARSLAGAN